MEEFIAKAVGFIWYWPVVGLCLLGCVYFTLRLGFIQLRSFPHAVSLISGKYDNPNEKGQITHFQALSAALSGTIGLGNIAGVAIAIALGGPGAIFWMWIIGFFGMATKYVECSLGTKYREEDENGVVHGGPMYYIKNGLSKNFRPLAYFYALCIAMASIGAAALFQSNQAASALHEYYQVPELLTGILLFILAVIVIIGGIKRIGNVASKIVPFMCVVYIGCALLICLMNISLIPDAFMVIVSDAFSGKAVASGSFVTVLLAGVRRAIFSNEAGLGSAAIAHAAVKTDYPIREGIVASLGPFIDTIVVCTATALVIIMSGNYGSKMYVNDGTLHSFEANGKPLLGTIIPIDKAPQQSDSLQQHGHGKHVLHLNYGMPYSISNLKSSEGLFRFAYYNEAGDIELHVYQNRKKIAQLSSSGSSTNPKVSVAQLDAKNEWKSAILSVPDAENPIMLIIKPVGVKSSFYLDAVEPVRKSQGIALTTRSFDQFFKGFGSIFITFSVFFFAFSTIITWSYYGETASYFLLGKPAVILYKIIFVCFILVGAVQSLDVIINFSDAMIGLLVIPNMIAILILSPKVAAWTKDYFAKLKAGDIKSYN